MAKNESDFTRALFKQRSAAPSDATATKVPDMAKMSGGKSVQQLGKDADAAYAANMDEQRNSIWPPNEADTTGNLKTYGKGSQFETPKGVESQRIAALRDKLKSMGAP